MKVHLWIRAEERANERRVGVTPDGVADLLKAGFRVTVEDSATRIIPTHDYAATGAEIARPGAWRNAPAEALVLGLKELPDGTGPLRHRHIFFGHAFKGQSAGHDLLRRFRAGGGSLFDLEYLVDDHGRRVAAFGYWAGFVGAALSVSAWLAQRENHPMAAVKDWPEQSRLVEEISARLSMQDDPHPTLLVIGALGRTGRGATALADQLGLTTTKWDMAETAHGGPFPEVLDHTIFLNCILASPGVPTFVPPTALKANRRLSVIGDIACDPTSDFNPIPVYDAVTSWADPVRRVADDPVLDIMAIDNLPSLLPLESSLDFSVQLLPHLLTLSDTGSGVWGRAAQTFDAALERL